MIFEVLFTPESEETFDAISQHLLSEWGMKIVLEFQAEVSARVKILSKSPFIYQVIDEALQIRKCPIHRNCSIIYRIMEKKVEVICFWDNRQESLF